MSIAFKVIERGEPGVAGGGQKKFYATQVATGESDIDNLTRSIERTSTVSGADIRAVLYGFVETMMDDLAAGKIVKLGELGNFRVSISSEGKNTGEEVNASAIKNARIIFSPGKKLKKLLQSLDYKKV